MLSKLARYTDCVICGCRCIAIVGAVHFCYCECAGMLPYLSYEWSREFKRTGAPV